MRPAGKVILWFGGFLMLWGFVLEAAGHEAPTGWQYPPECCHNMDCAPVEKTGENSAGEGIATTKLHYNITIKPEVYTYKKISPDGKLHVCATPDSQMAPQMRRRFYCIFNPEGM